MFHGERAIVEVALPNWEQIDTRVPLPATRGVVRETRSENMHQASRSEANGNIERLATNTLLER